MATQMKIDLFVTICDDELMIIDVLGSHIFGAHMAHLAHMNMEMAQITRC